MQKNIFKAILLTMTVFFNVHSTDLFKAVASNQITKVKKIIKTNTSLNDRDITGRTALDIAVERGNTKIARILLKNGAKVSSQANAVRLQDMLRVRAFKFFLGGLFLTPFMWIGSWFAYEDMSYIEVVQA